MKTSTVNILLASCMTYFVSPCVAENWAVLVCGSRGYFNYRHQADTCHAFQTLRSRGIPEDRIITMMYDDVANSPDNPFPGKLYNKPSGDDGVDVYEGCKVDYSGDTVTPENFLNVLSGNKQAMKDLGNGRVLESTEQDNVFVYFVDHGAVGLVAFPDDELYSYDLISTLESMHLSKKYNQLVFYMEACESGSMFTKLPESWNIFATTAANGTESSYAAYCPPFDRVQGHSLNTCLGDVYSVNWLEDADIANNRETLQDEYVKVKKETQKNSHVLEFGDQNMRNDRVGKYIGYRNPHMAPQMNKNIPQSSLPEPTGIHDTAVDSRDVDLVSHFYTYLRAPNSSNAKKLMKEIEHRETTSNLFSRITSSLVKVPEEVSLILGSPPEDANEWECHKQAVAAYKHECGTQWTTFSLRFSNTLLHLCERVSVEQLVTAISVHCDTIDGLASFD